MTGGTPYLATDTRALAERFQKILEDLEKSRIHDRGTLYAELYRTLPAGRRSRCWLWRSRCASPASRRIP